MCFILPPLASVINHRRSDARALVRLQADHVNRTLVPAFYRFLQAQKEEDQVEGGKAFHAALADLAKLFERAEREAEPHARRHLGLWVDGADLGWTDVLVGPCAWIQSEAMLAVLHD
jgi:glutathione S-transferase